MSPFRNLDLSGNRILADLPKDVADRLLPHLSLVNLDFKEVLCSPDDPIEYLYFPIQSVVSILVGLSGGETVEVGMVGTEGVVPIEAALGARTARCLAVVQISDSALRMTPSVLIDELRRGGVLFDRIHRHVAFDLAQVAQTAACNRVHSLDQRLCRWLLIARNRMKSDVIPITHEFLASMLGASRSEVTFAAGRLRKLGSIEYRQGQITIINLPALEMASCECYCAIEGFE